MNTRRGDPCRAMMGAIVGAATLAGLSGLGYRELDEPWKAPAWAAAKKNPVVAEPAAIVAGKAVYAANCLACHGTLGKGDGPAAIALTPKPEDLATAKIMDQTDGALFWKVTEGRAPMPNGRQLLTDTQRWQVVNYLRTLGPTPPSSDAPEPLRAAISRILQAYQSVQVSLAKGDMASAASAVSAVVEAADRLGASDLSGLDASVREIWQSDAKAIAMAAAALKVAGSASTPLREDFRKLSDALATMVAAFGHQEAVPVRVYVDATGADAPALWLQTAASPADPYKDGPSQNAATLQRQLAAQRPKP